MEEPGGRSTSRRTLDRREWREQLTFELAQRAVQRLSRPTDPARCDPDPGASRRQPRWQGCVDRLITLPYAPAPTFTSSWADAPVRASALQYDHDPESRYTACLRPWSCASVNTAVPGPTSGLAVDRHHVRGREDVVNSSFVFVSRSPSLVSGRASEHHPSPGRFLRRSSQSRSAALCVPGFFAILVPLDEKPPATLPAGTLRWPLADPRRGLTGVRHLQRGRQDALLG